MENRESAADPQPSVTVIMPILNEERHLRAAVDMILRQDYAGALDVVLALGPSTPDALNTAISASQGEVVVRVDGHAEIPGDYVRVAVEELTAVGADNVGGVMDAQGITPFQRAVACAMRSPIGVGNSRFHIGGDAGERPLAGQAVLLLRPMAPGRGSLSRRHDQSALSGTPGHGSGCDSGYCRRAGVADRDVRTCGLRGWRSRRRPGHESC